MPNPAHSAYLEKPDLDRRSPRTHPPDVSGCYQRGTQCPPHLANGDIRLRSQAISKACAILTELTVALDRKAGGEYAERLADLYGYMTRKLTEANFGPSEEALTQVLGLFTTLLENWEGVQGLLGSQRTPQNPVTSYVPATETAAYTPQAWSF